MIRGGKAPPTRPIARGPRSEHPRTWALALGTPRIRQRARPWGNLQNKPHLSGATGAARRAPSPPKTGQGHDAPLRAGPVLAPRGRAAAGRPGRGAAGEARSDPRPAARAGPAGRRRAAGRSPARDRHTHSGPGGPHPGARARLRLPTHLPGSPTRAQPQPVPPAPGRRPPPASGKDTKYTERKMSAQQSRREKTNTTASILLHGRRRRRSFRETGSGAPTGPTPPRPAPP